MRKVTRTVLEEEDDDMVRENLLQRLTRGQTYRAYQNWSVITSAGGSQHLRRQRVQPAQPDGGLRLLRTSFGQVQQLLRVLSLPLLPQWGCLRGSAAPLLRVQHQHSTQGGGQ